MRLRTSLVVIGLLTAALRAGSGHLEKLGEVFQDYSRSDGPGCSVAVGRDGQLVAAAGYGMASLQHGLPMRSRTVFYAGSVSKQFVAAAVLLAARQGSLSLDDDIRKFLPDMPDYGEIITVRHLIHHTSGLRDYLTLTGLSGLDFANAWTEAEILDMIQRQKELNFQPGERYLYSNTGYFLLAQIIRKATGQSLRVFSEEKIFRPLGMRDTHFHDDNRHLIKECADGHIRREDGSWGLWRHRFAQVGSGGLYTTVEDLIRWDTIFYDAWPEAGSKNIVDRMHERGRLNSGRDLTYAFGLTHGGYRGERTVSHGGSLGGYRAHLLRFPEHRVSIALGCNREGVSTSELVRKVADIVLGDQLAPVDVAPAPTIEEVEVDESVLQRYVGVYEMSPGQFMRVSRAENRLYGQVTGQPRVRLLPVSETDFVVPAVSARLSFETDPGQPPTRLVIHQGGTEVIADRPAPAGPEELKNLTGDFYSPELDTTYRIRMEGDRLLLRVRYRPESELEFAGIRLLSGGPGNLNFEADEQGAITGFRLNAGRVRNLWFEKR